MSRVYLIVIMLSFTGSAFSQKVKYKDIFAQIQAKNYDAVERVLKQFVFNPKNSSHANSHLQLAYIYERKLLAADILKDTAYVYGWADSASMYFIKSRQLITEKELKKNDEYYQAFNRRDLRSGEIGIKISDVHLEIETKGKATKSRGENIKGVNDNLKKANKAYNIAAQTFADLHGQYADYNLFLMKANDDTQKGLKEINRQMRASKRAISNMRRSLSLIENPGFGPEFKYADVETFPQSEVGPVDFYNGEFDLWDIAEWADETSDKLEKEIEPLKTDIVAYDRELTDYKSNLFSGGSVENKPLVFKERIMGELNKYDESSAIKDIIDIKIRDINILKIYAPTLNTRAADKEDIDYQLVLADSLVDQYAELDKAVNNLTSKDLDSEYERYSFFFDSRMKGRSGLDDFITEKQREVSQQSEYWQSQYDFWLETSQKGIMEFGTLPLFTMDSTVAYPNDSLNYLTLNMVRDDSLRIYPIGLEFGSSPKAYIASVGKDRYGLWYQKLDLGKMSPGDSTVNLITKFTPSEPDRLTFYYYSPISEEDNFIIYCVKKDGTLAWRNATQVDKQPFDVKFNETVFETIVYLDDPENPPAEGSVEYFVIDRTGKLRN